MMWANKFFKRTFLCALFSGLLWIVYVVLSFRNPSLTQTFNVATRMKLLQAHILRAKRITWRERTAIPPFITRPPARLSKHTTVPVSNDRYRVYRNNSGAKDDAAENHSLVENAHHNDNDPEQGLEIFHKKAANIVSKMKLIRFDPQIAQNMSFFKLRPTVVSRFNFTWLVQTTCPAEVPFLLIVIPSVYGHKAQRKAIRETWGSLAYGHKWPGVSLLNTYSVKLLFFLGVSKTYNQKDILSEAEAFQDIVVGDFADTYRNLSLKMASVLQWVDHHCTKAEHVVKVDEDTFVNLPLLLDTLYLFSQENFHFVLGHKKGTNTHRVSRSGRWEVPLWQYPLHTWPNYLYGHSYVISGDAIHSLRYASEHMPLVTNEDGYVTGVLALSAGVRRVHSYSFAVQSAFYRRCDLVNYTQVSQTGFRSVSALRDIWDKLKTGKCSQKERLPETA